MCLVRVPVGGSMFTLIQSDITRVVIPFVIHLATSFMCGSAIGLERQWRHRTAGLRTNALVALGSSLFVMVNDSFAGEFDRSRIAAQVVSGIGFLGAGVIMRDGPTVRGLNTAATIWCSAAVGLMAGSGALLKAFLGTGAIIFANVLLRPVAERVNRYSDGQPCAPTSESGKAGFSYSSVANE